MQTGNNEIIILQNGFSLSTFADIIITFIENIESNVTERSLPVDLIRMVSCSLLSVLLWEFISCYANGMQFNGLQ